MDFKLSVKLEPRRKNTQEIDENLLSNINLANTLNELIYSNKQRFKKLEAIIMVKTDLENQLKKHPKHFKRRTQSNSSLEVTRNKHLDCRIGDLQEKIKKENQATEQLQNMKQGLIRRLASLQFSVADLQKEYLKLDSLSLNASLAQFKATVDCSETENNLFLTQKHSLKQSLTRQNKLKVKKEERLKLSQNLNSLNQKVLDLKHERIGQENKKLTLINSLREALEVHEKFKQSQIHEKLILGQVETPMNTLNKLTQGNDIANHYKHVLSENMVLENEVNSLSLKIQDLKRDLDFQRGFLIEMTQECENNQLLNTVKQKYANFKSDKNPTLNSIAFDLSDTSFNRDNKHYLYENSLRSIQAKSSDIKAYCTRAIEEIYQKYTGQSKNDRVIVQFNDKNGTWKQTPNDLNASNAHTGLIKKHVFRKSCEIFLDKLDALNKQGNEVKVKTMADFWNQIEGEYRNNPNQYAYGGIQVLYRDISESIGENILNQLKFIQNLLTEIQTVNKEHEINHGKIQFVENELIAKRTKSSEDLKNKVKIIAGSIRLPDIHNPKSSFKNTHSKSCLKISKKFKRSSTLTEFPKDIRKIQDSLSYIAKKLELKK